MKEKQDNTVVKIDKKRLQQGAGLLVLQDLLVYMPSPLWKYFNPKTICKVAKELQSILDKHPEVRIQKQTTHLLNFVVTLIRKLCVCWRRRCTPS